MFTDDAVTPVRLEILVDLLRECRQGLARGDVYRLLQPESLNPDPKFAPARATIGAGIELNLVDTESDRLTLNGDCRKQPDSRTSILLAFDNYVLNSTEKEKYFALFYSYYLGLGKRTHAMNTLKREEWANAFNSDVFQNEPQANRFNEAKHKGVEAWFDYIGLGWFDPAGRFQANPYDRIRRKLSAIFQRESTLSGDSFMANLAATCPELDGGDIFRQANLLWKASDKKCTLGLSHALIELHLDRVIRLACPADSAGWSIKDAEPPGDEAFKSEKFSFIQLLNSD